MKRDVYLIVVFVLFMGACTQIPAAPPSPSATTFPPTQTASGTDTGTPSPLPSPTRMPTDTEEPTPSKTQTPIPALTIPVPSSTARHTRRPLRPATDTPSPTAEITILETPSPTATPTLACDRETALVRLSAPTETLKIGDAVQVTVTISNEGCAALGLPQYRLAIQSDGSQAVFAPEFPEPLVHSLAVGPGQSDSAEFSLIAVAEGEAILTAMVSYEVHLGYPGPAYWDATSSEQPLIITVGP